MAQKLPAKVQIKSPICTILLSKSDFSFALLLVTFEPLDIQQSYIPLLKALKCGINAVGAQGRGFSSLLCHAHLKMGVLLHKEASRRFIMILAVSAISQEFTTFGSKNSKSGKFLTYTRYEIPLLKIVFKLKFFWPSMKVT